MGKVIIKTISGQAFVGDVYLTDRSKLNRIDCQDEFVEYIHEDFKSKLNSGYMDFRFENDELYTYTIYSTKEVLTSEELVKLGEYTQGQWSDGIGEGFDHLEIKGYRDGLMLSAIVCTKCMDDKLSFINIEKRRSTIGNC